MTEDRTKTMRRSYTLALTLGLAFALLGGLFTSCHSGSRQSQQDATTDTAALALGVMPSVDYLPVAVAQSKHFFQRPLNLVRFASPMERDAALQTGSVDGSVTDYMGAMLLQSKGLKVVLPIACQGSFRLLFGREEKLSRITDLRDKHIGLSSNTLIDYATDRTLVGSDGKPFPYTKVEIQKIPIRLEMLRSGELDAAILPEPFATLGTSKGLQAINLPAGLVDEITGLVFQEKSLTAKDEALQDFIQGYNRGVDFIQNQPREQWVDALVDLLGIPREVALQMPLPTYSHATSPRPEALQPVLQWMRSRQLVPADYTAQGLIVPLQSVIQPQ